MIAENTARSAAKMGAEGKYSEATFSDLMEKPKVQQTGMQVVEDLTKRMGLEVITDGTV